MKPAHANHVTCIYKQCRVIDIETRSTQRHRRKSHSDLSVWSPSSKCHNVVTSTQISIVLVIHFVPHLLVSISQKFFHYISLFMAHSKETKFGFNNFLCCVSLRFLSLYYDDQWKKT